MAESVDWHKVIGFEPVAQRGGLIVVSGTGGLPEGAASVADVEEQTRAALEKIRARLEAAGSGVEDLVSVRIYLNDIRNWQSVGRVYGLTFGSLALALTMVEARLVDPRMSVEIEATAFRGAPALRPGPER